MMTQEMVEKSEVNSAFNFQKLYFEIKVDKYIKIKS